MITKERFQQGMTWDEYLGSIQKNQDLFKTKYEEVEIGEAEKAFFQGLPRDVYVLAIGEDWCPDVYNNLPVMARVAALNPKIQLRIFPRDHNHDLMHRYLFRGQSQSIPAFGFFDEHFQEFARHTGGRPNLLWDLIDQLGREEARPKLREHYAANKGREMLRELHEIFQKAGA
jgi:Thioredoxin